MPGFVKRYADAATASEAVRRASILRRQGVPTPAAQPGGEEPVAVFDRLAGTDGSVLLPNGITSLLRPVAVLHRASVPALAPFDPLLRVRPRLALATSQEVRGVADELAPSGTATLHGDLHVRQFVVEPNDAVWIVDLDDLAIGPPEADLANFAAHLATSRPDRSITEWSGTVRSAWNVLGEACDEAAFVRSLRFALARRHLKLREAGRPDFEAEVEAYLRDSSNFAIR